MVLYIVSCQTRIGRFQPMCRARRRAAAAWFAADAAARSTWPSLRPAAAATAAGCSAAAPAWNKSDKYMYFYILYHTSHIVQISLVQWLLQGNGDPI